MDSDILEIFYRLTNPSIRNDWKKSLDAFFTLFRKRFMFDNLAIYLAENNRENLEVGYARAAGRGRGKGEDVSWGEETASQAIRAGKIIESIPVDQDSDDRNAMPHLLGIPLALEQRRAALVFIRFGGPKYDAEQMPLASLAAVQTARILDQDVLQDSLAQLEHARHRAQLQDDFIATVSHEVHTPLGFIKGYTTSLLRSDILWDVDTQKEFLMIIDEESDHLLTLIDKMLDSARLQSGNMVMKFQPVRLDSLLRDVVMRIQSRHDGLKVLLDLAASPPIQADTVHLTQVFDNLFDNSIKYAPGAEIAISLKVEKNVQKVTFSDSGPGIAPEHIPFLFERFYRVPGQSGKSGTGLGLFICTQIIEAHNGEITVKTSPGAGTTFNIELPVNHQVVGQEKEV